MWGAVCADTRASLSFIVGGGVPGLGAGDPRPHSVRGGGGVGGVLCPSIAPSSASEADITVSQGLGSQILSSSFPPEPSRPRTSSLKAPSIIMEGKMRAGRGWGWTLRWRGEGGGGGNQEHHRTPEKGIGTSCRGWAFWDLLFPVGEEMLSWPWPG